MLDPRYKDNFFEESSKAKFRSWLEEEAEFEATKQRIANKPLSRQGSNNSNANECTLEDDFLLQLSKQMSTESQPTTSSLANERDLKVITHKTKTKY